MVGHALQASRIYAQRGVDELLLLDITATKENREPDYHMIESLAEKCFMPLTVGGGVKTSQHVRSLLNSGADKVCIGAAFRENPDIINELADKYGSSTIVVSLDVQPVMVDPVSLAMEIQLRGAGEILLQHIDLDGTMRGYDIDLIRQVSGAVTIPVVASSGCSGYENMYEALEAGASAVAAGALFQFTDATPRGAAEYLAKKGIEVRL